MHCNNFKHCNSFFFYQQNISVFLRIKEVFISNFFWKMMSFLKMSSWRHNPLELWRYLSKKWRNIIIIKKTVFGKNLVRKQSVQLMLWRRQRKYYAFKLLTSVPRDEIVFRKTQKLNFMRRDIQEGLQPAYFFPVIHIFRQGEGRGEVGWEIFTLPLKWIGLMTVSLLGQKTIWRMKTYLLG